MAKEYEMEKEIVLRFLNDLYENKFISKERKELWRYDEKRIKIDEDLDCIDRVISIIEKE